MSTATARPRQSAPTRSAWGMGVPRYRVFISYSHADTTWARWLIRRLETYRVPKRFHGRVAPIGRVSARIAPVFRDRDELPTTSDLGETIRAALRETATLVVICSPASARSRWVQEEIKTFKRLHGEGGVFAFIVDGEPKIEGTADDCFSPALRHALGADGELSSVPAEHVAADARPHADGKVDAFLRLVAGLLGVGFDELRRRELQRRARRLTMIAVASVAGMALTLSLAVIAWRARNEAVLARNDAQRRQDQAEDVLAFMLGGFRDELKKVGRLPLLDKVGDKAMAYFDSLDPRDLTDTALTRHAKLLTQIGEVRVEGARYAEAMRSFLAGYERARALAARHPRDGEMLFERGQAEYGIAFLLRQRGETVRMTEWFVRYRDTGAALVALDPAEPRWQEELASGYHNLAVVDLDAGRFVEARKGFLGKLSMLGRLVESRRTDLTLQFRIADANSWLGNIAALTGDLGEALARSTQYVASMENLLQAEAHNSGWRLKLADALALQAHFLAITGERRVALERRARATALFDALVAADPTNQAWLKRALNNRVKEASLIMAEGGDLAKSRQLLEETRPRLEQLAAAQPADRDFTHRLAVLYRVWGQLLTAAGEPGGDLALARAIELGEGLLAGARANEEMVGDAAIIRVTAAQLAVRADNRAARERHARRALELLGPRIERSNYWRVLDAAARAYALLGEGDRYRAIVARLDRMNYHALEPWPELGAAPNFVRNPNP